MFEERLLVGGTGAKIWAFRLLLVTLVGEIAPLISRAGRHGDADELRALYESKGVTLGQETVAYCRIGQCPDHTWFVLKYLPGIPKAHDHDGSWIEWGNLVGGPLNAPKSVRRVPNPSAILVGNSWV